MVNNGAIVHSLDHHVTVPIFFNPIFLDEVGYQSVASDYLIQPALETVGSIVASFEPTVGRAQWSISFGSDH